MFRGILFLIFSLLFVSSSLACNFTFENFCYNGNCGIIEVYNEWGFSSIVYSDFRDYDYNGYAKINGETTNLLSYFTFGRYENDPDRYFVSLLLHRGYNDKKIWAKYLTYDAPLYYHPKGCTDNNTITVMDINNYRVISGSLILDDVIVYDNSFVSNISQNDLYIKANFLLVYNKNHPTMWMLEPECSRMEIELMRIHSPEPKTIMLLGLGMFATLGISRLKEKIKK